MDEKSAQFTPTCIESRARPAKCKDMEAVMDNTESKPQSTQRSTLPLHETTEEYQARWQRIFREQSEEDRELAKKGIWPRRWG